MCLDNDFLVMKPKTEATKAKIQAGLRETKKLLHSKRNHQQNEKRTCEMGKNICKPYICYRVNTQSI